MYIFVEKQLSDLVKYIHYRRNILPNFLNFFGCPHGLSAVFLILQLKKILETMWRI